MQILNTKLTDSRRYDGSDLSDKSEKITFLYTLNQNNLSKKPGFTGLFRTYAVLMKAVMNRIAKQKENRKQAEILRKVHPQESLLRKTDIAMNFTHIYGYSGRVILQRINKYRIFSHES